MSNFRGTVQRSSSGSGRSPRPRSASADPLADRRYNACRWQARRGRFARPLGNLRRRNARVEPRGQAGMPQVMDALAKRRGELCRCEHLLPSGAPGAAKDRPREGVPRALPGRADPRASGPLPSRAPAGCASAPDDTAQRGCRPRPALQPADLMHLAGIRPLLPHLRPSGVEQQPAPVVFAVLRGQPGIQYTDGHRFLRPGPRAVQRGEEGVQPPATAGTAPDPAQETRGVVRVAARTLIVTARARSRVDLLFIREPTSPAEDRAPGVRWCRERLLRWRTNESLE